MNNKEYTALVDGGAFPPVTTVPIDPGFVDARGEIRNLLLTPITSVAVIDSKRGSVRANHYHRTDWHYAYVISGKVLYFERAIGATDVSDPVAYTAGDMFFTPPMREHTMLFAEDSVIMTFAKNVRDHATHEADLVRVEVVSPDTAARYVP
jgi:quercetin dioxygenase-like cupin family protein